MQTNWSLVLNVLLLIGVVVAIGRTMKSRRSNSPMKIPQSPSIGQAETSNYDEIVAVRKVSGTPIGDSFDIQQTKASERMGVNFTQAGPSSQNDIKASSTIDNQYRGNDNRPAERVAIQPTTQPSLYAVRASEVVYDSSSNGESVSSVMMFLLAKEERFLAGYELLQTVLAAGLRFGEGHLFHRHQFPNGQGPVLCSLAAATASGVFDLQNIGAFSVRGLCLFMQASGNSTIDAERFEIMLDTAKQLSEGLDAYLLDEQQKPLTDSSIQRYYRLLKLENVQLACTN